MDGQGIETVQNNSILIRWPYALTLDYDSRILYWADAFYDTISMSQTEPGSPITTIVPLSSGIVRLTYGIVTFEQDLFFTDWFQGIGSVKTDGTGDTTLIPRESRYLCSQNPYGIELISEQRQVGSKYLLHFVGMY